MKESEDVEAVVEKNMKGLEVTTNGELRRNMLAIQGWGLITHACCVSSITMVRHAGSTTTIITN